MKNKKKEPKPTTSIPQTVKDDTFSIFSWKELPVSEAKIDWLINKMFEWVRKEDSFSFAEFLFEYHIDKGTWYRWLDKFEHLNLAYKHMLMFLGAKREKKAALNEWNPATIHYTLSHYSDVWRSCEQQRIEIAQKIKHDVQKTEPIKLEIEMIPFSDKVPVKKVK